MINLRGETTHYCIEAIFLHGAEEEVFIATHGGIKSEENPRLYVPKGIILDQSLIINLQRGGNLQNGYSFISLLFERSGV